MWLVSILYKVRGLLFDDDFSSADDVKARTFGQLLKLSSLNIVIGIRGLLFQLLLHNACGIVRIYISEVVQLEVIEDSPVAIIHLGGEETHLQLASLGCHAGGDTVLVETFLKVDAGGFFTTEPLGKLTEF